MGGTGDGCGYDPEMDGVEDEDLSVKDDPRKESRKKDDKPQKDSPGDNQDEVRSDRNT